MKWQKDIAILFHFRWGRVCRLQWWVISILMAPLWFAADMVRTKEWRVEDTTEFVIVLATIPLLWINLAVGSKRYHDMNKSGWRQLLGLIPLVGPIWVFVELGFVRGTPGPNRFGYPGEIDAG